MPVGPDRLPWPTVPAAAGCLVVRRAGPPDDWPTLLVTMPFMDVDRPSIPAGLLKEIGTAHGFPGRTLHASLDSAARIGPDRDWLRSQHRGRMLGDWLFSRAAFGDVAPDPAGALLADFAADLTYLGESLDDVRRMLLKIRD